jgi:hypothetical protein
MMTGDVTTGIGSSSLVNVTLRAKSARTSAICASLSGAIGEATKLGAASGAVKLGAASDAVKPGAASDAVKLGAGSDVVKLGTGSDAVKPGATAADGLDVCGCA